MLLFLGDVILNPGSFSNLQLFKQKEWQDFNNRGLHLIHLNIDSLQPETDELRDKKEQKLPRLAYRNINLIAQSLIQKCILKITKFFVSIEIGTEEVACYIKRDISYKLNSLLPNVIKNITFNIMMPYTKLITIDVFYRAPNQSKFLDIFGENLAKLSTCYREIYFLGNFLSREIYLIISLFENWNNVFDKSLIIAKT